MRKITVISFLTMDGVLQSPGGPEEDTSGSFKWGGWQAPYSDDVSDKALGKAMPESFDLLLGRFTYDIFAAHWPYQKDAIGDKFNSINKYVVSGHPIELTWDKSILITGDVIKGIKELKKQDGPELLIHGSSKLIQTLLENGLVDTIHTFTYPVTIGQGKRLFSEGTRPGAWKLTDAQVSPTGVIIATYQPGGKLETGTFPSEPPSEAEYARRKKVAKEG